MFFTTFDIGDPVSAGQIVAYLDANPLMAPLNGVLRGLTHNKVPATAGTKVIEVDPRGSTVTVSGIGERPGRIAVGVLQAIEKVHPAAGVTPCLNVTAQG